MGTERDKVGRRITENRTGDYEKGWAGMGRDVVPGDFETSDLDTPVPSATRSTISVLPAIYAPPFRVLATTAGG